MRAEPSGVGSGLYEGSSSIAGEPSKVGVGAPDTCETRNTSIMNNSTSRLSLMERVIERKLLRDEARQAEEQFSVHMRT